MRCSAIVHPPDPARAVALSALGIGEYASIAASAILDPDNPPIKVESRILT